MSGHVTLYRHADGHLRDRPESDGCGVVVHRYHEAQVTFNNARIFERTAPIVQRSLASVGGVREGRQYSRRKNREARAAGFTDHAMFMLHLALLAQKQAYLRGAA